MRCWWRIPIGWWRWIMRWRWWNEMGKMMDIVDVMMQSGGWMEGWMMDDEWWLNGCYVMDGCNQMDDGWMRSRWWMCKMMDDADGMEMKMDGNVRWWWWWMMNEMEMDNWLIYHRSSTMNNGWSITMNDPEMWCDGWIQWWDDERDGRWWDEMMKEMEMLMMDAMSEWTTDGWLY